jgi:hypothetical protein
MYQVEVDEKEVGLALDRTHHVGVPELLRDGGGHRERQLYAAVGVEICGLATTRGGDSLVNMLILMSQPRVLGLVLVGLLGLIGIESGARAT